MAWWIRVQELKLKDKQGRTLYVKTATSDEDGGGPYELCRHNHRSIETADRCPEAKRNARRY